MQVTAVIAKTTRRVAFLQRRRGRNPMKNKATNTSPECSQIPFNVAEFPAAVVETVSIEFKGEARIVITVLVHDDVAACVSKAGEPQR
jgi:hypothetical protein